MPHRSGNRGPRDREWQVSGVDPLRLAAALMIPVSRQDEDTLTRMILRQTNYTETVAQ